MVVCVCVCVCVDDEVIAPRGVMTITFDFFFGKRGMAKDAFFFSCIGISCR